MTLEQRFGGAELGQDLLIAHHRAAALGAAPGPFNRASNDK
jgi:hypothetical protein